MTKWIDADTLRKTILTTCNVDNWEVLKVLDIIDHSNFNGVMHVDKNDVIVFTFADTADFEDVEYQRKQLLRVFPNNPIIGICSGVSLQSMVDDEAIKVLEDTLAELKSRGTVNNNEDES